VSVPFASRQPAAGHRPAPLHGLVWAVVLGLPAALLLLAGLRAAYGPRDFYDFHIFWHAGRDVLAGRNPYPAARVAALRGQDQFVYPAPAAVAMAPLALLPLAVAATAFILANLAAVVVALRLVGVRDWRCHALALCSLATLQGVVMGQVSCLLLLAAAAAWRWRDRTPVAAVAVATAIALKLFLVPLAVWLWVTGRRAAAALAVALAAAGTLVAWAVMGFRGMAEYPHLLSALSRVEQGFGFSPVALTTGLGLSGGAGRALALAATAALLIAAGVLARRADGDRRAFALAVVACLTLSPIVWLNYFVLLLAPLGLAARRLSPAWLLVLAPWIFANANTTAATWKILLWTATVAAIAWVAARRSTIAPLTAS
jgi:glycosyl transferase family 87